MKIINTIVNYNHNSYCCVILTSYILIKMSGSRTDIFTPNTAPRDPAMNGAASNAENANNDDSNTPRSRTTVPVPFKLALIAEVKKHDIIWQDRKQKKNSDLLDDAWQKIRRALRIKKTGFCEKQWKLLCHGYRSHINRNTPMHIDLIREMAFMTSQLKKSSSDMEPSDNENGDEPTRNKNPKSPKPKKVAKQDDDSRKPSEDEKVSVDILKYLFLNVSPEVMKNVKRQLVETLILVKPEVEAKISEHAKQQIARCGDINNIDWSTLDIPVSAEVCKTVWDHRLMQMLLK